MIKLFTPKPKRSEWMEGLLYAEECIKDGFSSSFIWRSVDNASNVFIMGVSDYIHHQFHTVGVDYERNN